MVKRIGILLAGATLCAIGFEVGGRFVPAPVQNAFVARVEAIIGRPLTPVSVAGVARRTARRCAVDIYEHC
jgi:hypothetical protein